MRAFIIVALSPLLATLAGCLEGLENANRPTLTPLEVQSLQQRDLETSKGIAFASVISVFQDLGYTIDGADMETGLITAASLAKSDDDDEGGFRFHFNLLNDDDDDDEKDNSVTTIQTKATAFVEAFTEDRTRVRLSFVESRFRSGAKGQNSTKDEQILDADIYRNAFDKIENAVFVREGALS